MIRVVAGLIIFENSVLVAKRKSTSLGLKNLWEFPGGKVEPGETDQVALQRELFEELGIHIKTCFPIHTHQFKNLKGQTIELCLYGTFIQDSKFECFDHDEVQWVSKDLIDQVDLLESNKVFISPVQDWLKARGFP
jgi:8-oxo-dGTP diphosphatase